MILENERHWFFGDLVTTQGIQEERDLFVTDRETTSIDVFSSASVPVGVRLRAYAIVHGGQSLVAESWSTEIREVAKGPVLSARIGTPARWRVTAYAPGDGQTGDVVWSIRVGGREPAADAPTLDPRRVPMPAEFGGVAELDAFTPVLVASEGYVRQVFGSLTTAGARWIQVWRGDPKTNGPGSSLVAEFYCELVGDAFSFDFRDAHRLAPANDGLYAGALEADTGHDRRIVLAASTTSGTFTPPGASLTVARFNAERRVSKRAYEP
jgi:hypothetical protein